MLAFPRVLIAVFAVSAAGTAFAQARGDLERCRVIADDPGRLACYDAIPLTGSSPASKYESVALGDFKAYALSYRGDLVEVAGWVRPVGTLLMLGANAEDERAIPVEYDGLPRRDREAFLAACGQGCQAAVQGRVRPVNFTTGISADALKLR